MLGGRYFVGLAVAAGVASKLILLPQFPTVAEIPTHYFQNHQTIYGRVEKVIDGDTIRAIHCKNRFSCPQLDANNRSLARQTMSIRIYAVDCPEIRKRRSDPPSQPFGEEAKEYSSSMVLGEKVKITLLRKDQYGRAVAKVEHGRRFVPPLAKRDLSMDLLKEGLATVYTGGGAEYDGSYEDFLETQRLAKKRRRGVWSLGEEMVSPAEFKRQMKQLKQVQVGVN